MSKNLNYTACLTAALLPCTGACKDTRWVWESTELAAVAESVVVEPLKFGKSWAYALEFDDGGIFARDVAESMLTRFGFTDAPPGVPGGRTMPFVASLAIYPLVIDGGNNEFLNWEHIRALQAKGWGVSNHSYWHTGNHWEPENFLDEAQMRRELFWSQGVFSHFLSDGHKILRHFVYPSGDSRYRPFLAEYGLNTTSVAFKDGNLLTVTPAVVDVDSNSVLTNRNNMDAGAWDKRSGDDMDSFPQPRPEPGAFVLDFTHGMGKAGGPNALRWERRLGQISSQFGAEGDDSLWCGSTAEIMAYQAVATRARAGVDKGGIFVEVPEGSCESPLTLRIRLGRPLDSSLLVPPGALVYRRGTEIWVTTPPLGSDATPEFLRAKPVHAGPFHEKIVLPTAIRLAGVRLLQNGNPGDDFVPDISWVAKDGSQGRVPVENILKWSPMKSRWGHWLLFPIVPDQPAPEVVELSFSPSPYFKGVELWSVE